VHHWGPFFEEDGKNASDGGQLALEVPLGGSVLLNCRVGMLHDKTVSTESSKQYSNILGFRTTVRNTSPGQTLCSSIRHRSRNVSVITGTRSADMWSSGPG
jgi:hypothetical protein